MVSNRTPSSSLKRTGAAFQPRQRFFFEAIRTVADPKV